MYSHSILIEHAFRCHTHGPINITVLLHIFTSKALSIGILARSKLLVRQEGNSANEEDAMKTTMRTLAAAVAAMMTTAAPAFAAPTYTDNSGLLVWSFLGFCAVIVLAQVMPAVLMMVGMAKGFVTAPKEVKAHN